MKDIGSMIERMITEGMARLKNLPADLLLSARIVKPLLIVVAITLTSFFLVDIFYKGVALQFVGSLRGGAKPARSRSCAEPGARRFRLSGYYPAKFVSNNPDSSCGYNR